MKSYIELSARKFYWEEEKSNPHALRFWSIIPLTDWFMQKYTRVAAAVTGAFILYYLVPNIISSYSGAGLSKRFSFLPGHLISENKNMVCAFGDNLHIVFAVTVPLICFFIGICIIRYSSVAVPLIVSDSCILISRNEYNDLTAEFIRKLFNPIAFIIPVAFGLLTYITFIHLEKSPHLINWWAHSMYGNAGTVLAFNISWVIAAGIWGAEFFILLFLLILKIFQNPIKLRPFAPDNCNGLLPLGKMLIMIYIVLFFAGVAFWVIYYKTYFGLEKTILFHLTVIVYFIVIIFMVFVPMILIANRIMTEKFKMLRILENSKDDEIRRCIDNGKEVNELENYVLLYERIESINVLPFSSRSMVFLTLSFAGQIFSFMYSFIF